ncbi:hypothetical protein FIBSPDRAFT_867315 [Athelia psychrophila]|uniref:BTB domain-containing protein n=1 Tax=Athelia psychrophila TaxID=1759441 RepID=A0A166E4I9_9AGAM|nr:hypothetical protein FIBSPDRAFT_867315 [Fibularhizoctonia sp. CBS 109695]
MTLDSSRPSSPFAVTITEASVDQTELEAKTTKHPRYSFEDGNTLFLVEGTLYNVHRYFFVRDSTHFRTILQGTDDHNPCMLSGVNCADFDEFLAILYPTDFRQPTKKTTPQWTSILHLAAKWGFENIKLLAIDNLTANASPVDKIVLGRRYGITDWLPGAYEAVCTRADPLTVEEGMKLGVEDVVRISAARQVYGTGKARHEAKYLAGDLGEIFNLGTPSERSSLSVDGEEDAIRALEDQVAEARTECVAGPIPHAGACLRYSYRSGSRCDSCAGCNPESNEQKVKREAREQKERQLEDLKSRLETRRQALVGRQGRMASFR